MNTDNTAPVLHAPAPSAEENDDRYVKICSLVKVKGEALREEAFAAIEAGDFATAIERAHTIQLIDRCYMLSLQRGMGIHEARKKKEQDAKAAARLEELRAQEAANPGSTTIHPSRRTIFDRVFKR
jgi:hypothetical protein